MAIAFELVADFGGDQDAAESCRQWFDARITPVKIDEYTINIHDPFICGDPYKNPTRFKIVILPANVGLSVAIDDADYPIPLTEVQISRLGNALYDLLRGAPDYQLAMVGWDVDHLLDLDDLNADWASEIGDGSFNGFVASKTLLSQLPVSSYFAEFDEEHVWIPYSGSQAL